MFCQQCGGATDEQMRDGRTRPVCLQCGTVTYLDPKLAAGVVIERDGRLLFGKRGPGATAGGKWGLPAGFVERGERIEDAAIREAHEEIGLEVSLGPLLGLYSETGQTVVLAVFEATVGDDDPVAADDLEAVGWFSPDDLPELAFPRDRAIVALWSERRSALKTIQ